MQVTSKGKTCNTVLVWQGQKRMAIPKFAIRGNSEIQENSKPGDTGALLLTHKIAKEKGLV